MLKLPFKNRANRWMACTLTKSMPGLATVFALLSLCVGTFSASGQEFRSSQPQLVLPQQQDPLPQATAPFEKAIPEQPPVPAQAAIAEPRTAAKPVISSNSASVMGATYIALDSRLKQVFRGSEPKSLAELRAMDEQQSKVAAVIDQVTVNVQQGSAQGSGAVISGDGYILTAAHVAGKPGRQAWVRFSDGTRVEAITLGMDRNNDAGLIKITSARSVPWPHATLGKSESLNEGQWCIAAGHPGGWQPKRGSVIRVGRILSIKGKPANTLFTDCTLIGGDSGGPLFTLEGKLIGIHSRIGTDMEDNMHVPIEVYETSWQQLASSKAWGVLPGFRPLIGVRGLPDSLESVVGKVIPDSPAEVAGLVVGDRIRSFDGVRVETFAELQAAVEQTLPGDTVFIEIVRDGTSLRFPLVVGVEGD